MSKDEIIVPYTQEELDIHFKDIETMVKDLPYRSVDVVSSYKEAFKGQNGTYKGKLLFDIFPSIGRVSADKSLEDGVISIRDLVSGKELNRVLLYREKER